MSVTVYLLYILLGIAVYFLLEIRCHFSYWKRLGIPFETPNWLLGNLRGVNTKKNFFDICSEYYKKFKGSGPFVGFFWFTKPAAFVLEPELIKHVLIKDFTKFMDRGFYVNEKDDPLSGQLFLLEGQKWRNMRNKLSPTFTSGKMKFMLPAILKVGDEFLKVFTHSVEDNNIVEVKELLARFTVDVIGTCAFGIDCNSLNNPKAEFLVMGRRALTEQRHGLLGVAFLFIFPKLARKFGVKQTPDVIEDFYMRIVRETVNYREQNNIQCNDFMNMLIELKNNKLMKSVHGDELTNLTLEEIAAQAFVFFSAGFETSSTTMSFALYELAQHEDIQSRARKEIIEVLHKHDNQFTYDCLKELEYTNQIISETLRMYTVLPMINRFCLEDFVMPDNPKYVIKKDTMVIIPAAAIHLDEDYYPNPHTFNPDNFSAANVAKRDPLLWLPFGDGPRNCIGKRFGIMQTLVGLSLLLKNFKFSTCEKTEFPLKYNKESFLLAVKNGIYLKVTKI